MCGLVGIAGDLQYRDEAAMKRLFLADFFRGPDSTGLAVVKKTGETAIAKLASNPIDLFDMARFKAALTGHTSRAFIGHNRAATKGAVNNNNAHPFEYGKIVGAHNGTLDVSSFRALEDAVGETFEVDSMAIFAAIDKIGLEETVKLLEGAWALVFYNKEEGTLNFLRNDKRPFWYAFTSDFKKILWASEWEMIDTTIKLCAKGDYELFKENKTNYCYFATEVNVHYKFDLDELAKGGTARPKAKAKTLKGKEPSPVKSVGTDPFGRIGGTTQTPSRITTPSTTKRNNPQRIKHFVGSKDDPLAGYMPWEGLKHLTACVCSYCQADVVVPATTGPSFTYYERENMLLCSDCGPSESNQIRIYPKNYANFELNK